MKKLTLNDLYSREDVHSIFSPETSFEYKIKMIKGGKVGAQKSFSFDF